MNSYPEPIQQLTDTLSRLPGIGPRSAERIALSLAFNQDDYHKRLITAIQTVKDEIQRCVNCGALTDKSHQPCVICSDEKRNTGLICIVEKATDTLSFSRAEGFLGRFHVLGGKLSPLNGVEPDDLNIASLHQRIEKESIREIVIALSTDVEGEATAYYLAREFAGTNLKVSRIASGLPVGSGIEFADELTLSRALEGRREILGPGK